LKCPLCVVDGVFEDFLIGLMGSGENFVDSNGFRGANKAISERRRRPGRSSAVSLGRKLELGLGVGSCRGNGWRPGRHADTFEKGPDRGGLSQGSHNAHAPPTIGAFGDVDLEYARQQLGP